MKYQVFELIRKDDIDILVDLSGYTGTYRLDLFAKRAAPIQVSYLGYPNTTGMSRIDYRLVDDWTDPTGKTEKFYSESLVRLASGFLCYYPNPSAPCVSELPANGNGRGVCFGSFNSFHKITNELLSAWANILLGIEGSTLIIKTGALHEESMRDTIHAQFETLGIEPARVELLGWNFEKLSHLDVYSKVDIHLDTSPYNGTTTTCEALWQGVPTITLTGDVHRARVGVSILTQVGLSDYIAKDLSEYVTIAVKKARDLSELSELRKTLREQMRNSMLMDVEAFSTELANAYETMYLEYTDKA